MSWSLALVPFLIALNAFFVAAEYAVVAIKQHQIEQMRQRGRRRAAAAMSFLKTDPASAIGAIQVCITLTNLLLGGLGEPPMTDLLKRLLGPLAGFISPEIFVIASTAIAFTVVTFLTVVFSELLPKALTLRYVSPIAVITAPVVVVIQTSLKPIVWLMNFSANLVTRPLGLGRVDEAERDWHTADEIRLIATQAADAGALSARERSLILNTLTLGRRTARQIMVPRSRIAYLDLTHSLEENQRLLNEHLYSRMPLCNGGIDNVIGIVRVREALTAFYADGDVSTLQLIAQPAVFAPDTIPVDKLLILIDEKQTQVILLVDEHGGIEGLVTLRDVVDELVGKPLVIANDSSGSPGERRLVVSGDLPLHELSQTLGIDLNVDATSVTVSGLITEHLGRFPRTGDRVEVGAVKLHVLKTEKRVIKDVEVVC
jgi:CBS domain containing-hemolysin-like protein